MPRSERKHQISRGPRSSRPTHAKSILLMMLVLRYPISRVDQEQGRLEKYYEIDVNLCPKCFSQKSKICSYLNENFQFDFRHVFDVINSLAGTKHVYYGNIKNIKDGVIAKHSYNKEMLKEIRQVYGYSRSNNELEEMLSELFSKNDRPGFHFCHRTNLDLLIDKLTRYTSSRLETWVHLLINVETILLAALNNHASIPTPKYYSHCGLTVYEAYEGATLHEWKRSNVSYVRKLEIARQLLNAALSFSEGFDVYRIYLTDLTLDNVVYNDNTGKISVIDLDSVVIVDGIYNRSRKLKDNPPKNWQTISRHEKLECEGCLAYQMEDFCNHYKSDFNIFAVCQLLDENLYGDKSAGYLKPIPKMIDEEFPNLRVKLQQCVNCPFRECRNRFEVSEELVRMLDTIIESIS